MAPFHRITRSPAGRRLLAPVVILVTCGAGGAVQAGDAGPADRGLAEERPVDGGTDSDAAVTGVAGPSDASAASAEPATITLTPATPPEGASVSPAPSELMGRSAEDMDGLDLESLLENVVVSATKSALREDEAPAITTVVSRDDIRRWGYQTVAEVLSHVAGVYLIDDHIVPNLGLRGISGGLKSESGLVKVMIDGHPVAFRSTAGNWLGAGLVPLSAVQQIEIIRGPASALYGADAFLGVINVVTRRPDQVEGGELGAGVHRYRDGGGHSEEVTLAATRGRWQLLASFAQSSDDRSGLTLPASSPAPNLPSYAPADRRARGLVLGSRTTLGSLGYQLSPTLSVTATGYLSELERGAEFADWAQLTHNLDADGRSNGTNVSLRHGFAKLGVNWRPTAKLDVALNAAFFSGGPTRRDRIEVGSDIFYMRRDFGYRGADVAAEATWRFGPTLTTLIGVGVIADQQNLPATYQVAKANFGDVRAGEARLQSQDQGDVTLWNPGVHGLALWAPWPRVSVVAGARYDHHNIYGGKPSGRLGGVVALATNLHLKILYGSAFKAPSPQLLWGAPLAVGDIQGNRALKPSYVHTVEGQLVYRPASFMVTTTGVAYSYLLDQAEFAQVGVNQVARNVARLASLSWETELKFDWRKRLAVYGNLSVNLTQHRGDRAGYVARLTDYSNAAYPRVVANAGASAVLPRLPLRLSVEGTFVSARESSSTNTLEAGQRYALPAYVSLGASLRTVGLELLPHREIALALTARNLLDSSVADPGFSGVDYPRLGRSVLLQVVQQF